jgi:homopolymeric O-antigen transport system permease protein
MTTRENATAPLTPTSPSMSPARRESRGAEGREAGPSLLTAPHTPSDRDAPRRRLSADLAEHFRDLWAYRELLLQFTRRDIRVRYKQAAIGVAWAVLTPLVVILSGWVLRLAFGRISGEMPNDQMMAGVAVKSLGWAFFVGAMGFGTASITGHLSLITKTYFPRAILPIASVLTQLVDAAIALAALAIALPFFGVGFSLGLLWVLPVAILLVLFTTAVTLAASCANVFFRDAKHLVQIVLSFGIFFTPVFFDASAFGPTGSRVVMLNPLSPMLEGLRLAIVQGHNLARPLVDGAGLLIWTPAYLAYSAAVAIVGLLLTMAYFHRAEFDFAEYV